MVPAPAKQSLSDASWDVEEVDDWKQLRPTVGSL